MTDTNGFAVPAPPAERSRGPNYVFWGCAIIIILGVLLLGSCAAFLLQGKRAIEPYGDQFFAAWDSEDDDALRAMIAESANADDLVATVRAHRDELGAVQERIFRGFNINTSTEGGFADATYHVQFQSGTAQITLSFVDENDVWMLSAVNISADATTTRQACPSCGHVNAPGSNFCSECGQSLELQPEADTAVDI